MSSVIHRCTACSGYRSQVKHDAVYMVVSQSGTQYYCAHSSVFSRVFKQAELAGKRVVHMPTGEVLVKEREVSKE